MRQMLYMMALLMTIGWVLGFLVLSLGNLVHILIVFAGVAFLLGLTREENT